jgi:hypothetical protein
MPRRKISLQDALLSQETYGAPRIEGKSNLLIQNILNPEVVEVGEQVMLLALPNGKYYLEKSTQEGSVQIEMVTPSHVLFAGLDVEEEDADSR